MKITHNLLFVVLLFSLLYIPATNALANPTVTDLTLVSEKRISRTTFEYTYKVTFQNDNASRTQLTATVSSAGAGTTIIEGSVAIGSLSPNQIISPDDTITLRQDRLTAFDRNALAWVFNEASPPPTTGVLLPGNANDLALTAIYDYTIDNIRVDETDIATDTDGNRYALTRLDIELDPLATVGQINTALQSISGSIVGMIEDLQIIVIEIPNPGSLAQLEIIIATLKTFPGIVDVSKPGFLDAGSLPPAFMPSSNLSPITHHLAIRAHAAWNILDSYKNLLHPPNVGQMDFWGSTSPTIADGYNIVMSNPGQISPYPLPSQQPDDHGYHVLGIMGATWDDQSLILNNDATGLAGMMPYSFNLTATDVLNAQSLHALLDFIKNAKIQKQNNGIDRYILNYSVGYRCDESNTRLSKDTNDFVLASKAATKAGLQILLVAAAMNYRPDYLSGTTPICGAAIPLTAEVAGPLQAAALNTGLTYNGVAVPNLDNALVVENVIAGSHASLGGPVLEAICINDGADPVTHRGGSLLATDRSSKSLVSGIGTEVYSLMLPGTPAGRMTGTSQAAPQVAGLAIWLWSIEPSLSLADLKDIIVSTASTPPINASANPYSPYWGCSTTSMAPVIDAYRATLALDKVKTGSVRKALFDVALSNHTVASPTIPPDGIFDHADLRLWVNELLTRKGANLDYSRYDLNGDGRTGEIKTAIGVGRSFDLDANRSLEMVPATIEGVSVSFDENALTDTEILCYYAYSALYTGDTVERSILMIPLLNQCGVKLATVNIKIDGSANGYNLPITTTLQAFGAPMLFNGFWSGAGTCGGEQGGPVWSSKVEFGSYFLPATQVVNPPLPLAVFPNRQPCSSFFAVKDGKIWFNATGRRWQITGGFITDIEYQARYFADPQYGIAPNTISGRTLTMQLGLGSANVQFYGNYNETHHLNMLSNPVAINFTFIAK